MEATTKDKPMPTSPPAPASPPKPPQPNPPAPAPVPKPKPMEHEPIDAIVDRFLGEIQVHPESNLLGFTQGGAIPPSALLPGLSPMEQQLISLRFVMRKPLRK